MLPSNSRLLVLLVSFYLACNIRVPVADPHIVGTTELTLSCNPVVDTAELCAKYAVLPSYTLNYVPSADCIELPAAVTRV